MFHDLTNQCTALTEPCLLVDCVQDKAWINSSLLTTTTTMALTRFTSNTVYAVLNNSILSVTDVSFVANVSIDPNELRSCYNATFNNPADQNSLYLGTQNLIQSGIYGIGSFGGTGAVSTQGFLALPFLFFQPVNRYFDVFLNDTTTPPTPCVFGTTVSRIIIAKWTLIAFAFIAVSVYLWCIGGLCWAMCGESPPITQFPILDFALRIASGEESVQKRLSDAPLHGGFRKYLQDRIIFLGITVRMAQAWTAAKSMEARELILRRDESIASSNAVRGGNDDLEYIMQNTTSRMSSRDGRDEAADTEMSSPFIEEGGQEIRKLGFGFQGKDTRLSS